MLQFIRMSILEMHGWVLSVKKVGTQLSGCLCDVLGQSVMLSSPKTHSCNLYNSSMPTFPARSKPKLALMAYVPWAPRVAEVALFMMLCGLCLQGGMAARRCWCVTNPSISTLATKEATYACCRATNSAPCDITDKSSLTKNGLASGSHACASFINTINPSTFASCCNSYSLGYVCDNPTERTCLCAGSSTCIVYY